MARPRQRVLDIDLRPTPYDAPVVLMLVQEMADDLARHYGPASYPPQDPTQWAAPHGAMFVAYIAGEPAACGGLIRHDEESAELKRIFVRPTHRRMGVARRLLAALDTEASRLGYRRTVLETGIAQVEALSLYVAGGYQEVPCWPPHDNDPTSVCFMHDLAALSPRGRCTEPDDGGADSR